MKYYTPQHKQLTLDLVRSSLDNLDKSNRWVQMGDNLPWSYIENVKTTYTPTPFCDKLLIDRELRILLHTPKLHFDYTQTTPFLHLLKVG